MRECDEINGKIKGNAAVQVLSQDELGNFPFRGANILLYL